MNTYSLFFLFIFLFQERNRIIKQDEKNEKICDFSGDNGKDYHARIINEFKEK